MSDKPVERFDLGYSFYDCPEMQSSETGGYVEFAAYEALKAENEKLEAHFGGALDSIREHQQICNDLKAENEAQAKRIAELENIKQAAENLVNCKGRYHTEQNMIALTNVLAASKNGDSK